MSLASLVDKPLMQNPLAGGAMTSPQESQLQGDALVQQMQMRMQQRDQKTPAFMAYFGDVMDTKGYPTKTMQEYQNQFPETTPQQVPLGAGNQQEAFDLSKINKNPYNTEFIGLGADQTNLFGYKVPDEIIKAQEENMKNNPIDMSAILRPGMPGYTPLAPILDGTKGFPVTVSGDDSIATTATVGPNVGNEIVPMVEGAVQTPLSGDQGLMDRLTSLEQGIGSLQNQIANLFQMGQASDPFGLGGFMNQRRF